VNQARVSGAALQAKLWYWQRLSAMVLAVCVVIHLVMIVYASRGGLTAADILARTRGNIPFAVFYSVFVVACAVHVPIGLKAIAIEWLGWRDRNSAMAAVFIALALLAMGLRAVYAVIV
jgi:fumarate reductase subunit C